MSQGVTTSIDDTSSNITYSGNWLKDTNFPSIYNLYQNSDSYSEDYGASATLRFYGTSIEYWGNQDFNRGPCTLTLDGNNAGTVTSYAPNTTPPLILYSNYNLALGDHTLVITVASQQSGLRCEIDRFVVGIVPPNTPTPASPSTSTPASVEANTPSSSPGISTSPPSTTNSSTASAVTFSLVTGISISISPTSASIPTLSSLPVGADVSDLSATSSHSIPVSVFIGSVLGAIALVCLFIFLFWLYRRHKRAASSLSQDGSEAKVEDGSGISSPYPPSFTAGTPISYTEGDWRIRTKEAYSGNSLPLIANNGDSRLAVSDVSTRVDSPPPPPAYRF